MATALRSVGHDDRLSLVEHLTELRVRIVICLVAFVGATALCMWKNQEVLDVLNRPLSQTMKSGHRDPIQQGAGFDQAMARWLKEDATLAQRTAASVEDPALRAALVEHARESQVVAKLAPKIEARKPVTLGVSEPFMQTLKVSMYAGL